MTQLDYISTYLGKPCKFRLQTGKEVFGVLWNEVFAGEEHYYFASTLAHQRYLKAIADENIELCDSLRTMVDVQDFAGACLLSDQTEAA